MLEVSKMKRIGEKASEKVFPPVVFVWVLAAFVVLCFAGSINGAAGLAVLIAATGFLGMIYQTSRQQCHCPHCSNETLDIQGSKQ